MRASIIHRYFYNTVTFDYTSAFWDFDEWSLELDWLALRGVNMPLQWVGYEYILVQVFREAGLSDAEITSFLSGPCFQAWNRFGNIQGSWGGDLPEAWVNDQFTLGKQITDRMVELGMTPVLPAFTGFVPRAMPLHYPNASIVNGSQWSGFPPDLTNVTFLEPFDPLFATLQKSFLEKQRTAFGDVTHVYTLDQYNENNPMSGDLTYLANVSAGTFASLRAVDPDAIWMAQGWAFFSSETFWTNDRVSAYLGGAPGDDSMIILDLYSEAQPQWQRLDSYFGKPWVWCELHGYGGNIGWEGNLQTLAHDPVSALSTQNSSMMGIGVTMEGQEGNEIVYDFILDQAWSSSSINVSQWVASWVSRRYHVKDIPQSAYDAWKILSTTVYNNTDPNSLAAIKGIHELAPATSGLVNRTGHHPTEVPYSTDEVVVPALQKLVQAKNECPDLASIPEFQYDAVDFARQLLSNRFIDAYTALIATWNSSTSSADAIKIAGKPLLQILSDMDAVLYTNENFLLSKWIGDAKSWDHGNKSYAQYLEYSARNQITLWGPEGNINDYASKSWAGLVGTYYKPRWEKFIGYLVDTRKNGTAYNATAIAAELLDWGQEWDLQIWGQQKGQGWSTEGNTWEIVEKIVQDWAWS